MVIATSSLFPSDFVFHHVREIRGPAQFRTFMEALSVDEQEDFLLRALVLHCALVVPSCLAKTRCDDLDDLARATGLTATSLDQKLAARG